MDEITANTGHYFALLKSNSDDVQSSNSQNIDTCSVENETLHETFFDIPVQIKSLYQDNGSDLLPIWCENSEMPQIDEMLQLASIAYDDSRNTAQISDTPYPEFSEILTGYVNKMSPQIIDRFKETETIVVACKTLTRKLIYQAYAKKITESVSEINKRPLAIRVKREKQWLSTLCENEKSAISTTLEIIKKCDSVWLINTLKYACSVRGEELERAYGCSATSFEHKETTWYEIRWDRALKKKIREAITSYLPDFMRNWLVDLRIRRENLRKIIENA